VLFFTATTPLPSPHAYAKRNFFLSLITLELEVGSGAPPNSVATGKKPSEVRIKAVTTALNVGRTSLNKAAALIR